MRRKLRRHEDVLAALACYGIAGLALAYGMWVAGSPLDDGARFAVAGGLTQVQAEISR